MAFTGFDPTALALLAKLPAMDERAYASHRDLLAAGVREPGAELITAVASAVDSGLTVDRRSSVSPLHNDLRFAPPGAPRYKDHLLLTAWNGPGKKTSPTIWIRIDSKSAGFASGVPFTPEIRERYRNAASGAAGENLAQAVSKLEAAHAADRFELAGDELKRTPKPWLDDHPRAGLLRKTGLQARFMKPLPAVVNTARFVDWCIDQMRDLVPVHQWLVAELVRP